MSAIRREMLLSANSGSRPMERSFDDSNIPSTIVLRWNFLSPLSGALKRGRLLACCASCGPVLAIRQSRRDADGFPLFAAAFTLKSAFSASLSLKAPDL